MLKLLLVLFLVSNTVSEQSLEGYCSRRESQLDDKLEEHVKSVRVSREKHEVEPSNIFISAKEHRSYLHLARKTSFFWVSVFFFIVLLSLFCFGLFNICRPDVFCFHTTAKENLRLTLFAVLLATTFVLFLSSVFVFLQSNTYILATHDIQCTLVRLRHKFTQFKPNLEGQITGLGSQNYFLILNKPHLRYRKQRKNTKKNDSPTFTTK